VITMNLNLISVLLITAFVAPATGQMNTTQTGADYYFGLGTYFYNIDDYNDSLQAYNEVIQINPQDADAWNNMGIDLGLLGRPVDALNAFYKAATINSSYAEPWYNMGVIFDSQGAYENAVQAYDRATIINPSYEKAWYNKDRDQDIIGIPHTSLYLELTNGNNGEGE